MPNTFQNTQFVLDETLVKFANQLRLVKTAYRQFEKDYKNLPYSTGETLNYRLEENYLVAQGTTATPQDRIQRIRALTIEAQRHIMVNELSRELTLDRAKDPENLARMLAPIARNLANDAEKFLADKMKDAFFHAVGTPGTAISSPNLLNEARGFMNQLGIPEDGMRYTALTQNSMVTLANGVNNFFNKPINTQGLMQGLVGSLAEFDLLETIFLGRHQAGVGGGNPAVAGRIPAGTVDGNIASGSAITVKALGFNIEGTFLKGDVIEIAGTQSVNPITKQTTNRNVQFVLTADAPQTSGTGTVTIQVSPEILLAPSPFQNMTGVLGDNFAITLFDSHEVNIAYHHHALVFAAPPMKHLVGGVVSQTAYNDRYAIALRYMQGGNITTDTQGDRMDYLPGATINPEFGVRIMGA